MKNHISTGKKKFIPTIECKPIIISTEKQHKMKRTKTAYWDTNYVNK